MIATENSSIFNPTCADCFHTCYLFAVFIKAMQHNAAWNSYTRAHKGLGPGNFLSALVTFEVLTSMLSSYIMITYQNCCGIGY